MASNRVTYPGVGVESVQISERDGVDNPVNPYADTLRRKNEERGKNILLLFQTCQPSSELLKLDCIAKP